MKFLKKIFMICLILFSGTEIAAAFQEAKDAREEFETRCPKPQWWEKVPLGDVRIYTYDDLIKYWQDQERTESQFFKAAYQAILDSPLDADIVVNGIKLMNYTRSYPYRIELQEYAMENYFSYMSLYGRPGNSIASIARNLGELYNHAGEYDKTLHLIQRVLQEREKEINDHLLELMHLTYAEALHGQNRTEEAVRVLRKAVNNYNGSWEERLLEAIARYEGTSVTASSAGSAAPEKHLPIKEEPWWKKNMAYLGGFLVFLFIILVLRRASEQQVTRARDYPLRGQGTDSDVERLVREGQKIAAIKLYREIHHVGLKESKDAIDKLAGRVGRAS